MLLNCEGGLLSEQFLLIHSQLKLSANRIVCYTNAGVAGNFTTT